MGNSLYQIYEELLYKQIKQTYKLIMWIHLHINSCEIHSLYFTIDEIYEAHAIYIKKPIDRLI